MEIELGHPKGPRSRVIGGLENDAGKVILDNKQLQKKFKHAGDFGVEGNYNKENLNLYKQKLENHLKHPGTELIEGVYRGDDVDHFHNITRKKI